MPLSDEHRFVQAEATQHEDFSLVLGGPLYQLLLRIGLIRPPVGHLSWRIAVITGLAWLPLAVFTIFGGRFAGGVMVPFLYDFEVHVRLLFSLPLLILAEVAVYFRMRALAVQFVERQIITHDLRPAFHAVLSSAMRLRNSVTVEAVLLLLVTIAGPLVWRGTVALSSDTWYAIVTGPSPGRTEAGRWYNFISIPVFQFILLRWYYRLFIWCRFLFQVSRLNLNLVPLHPDRRCGLGFLGDTASAFAPLLAAHSGLLAGFIASRILHQGTKLPDYAIELAGMPVFLLAIVLGPLCVFAPKLSRARLTGLRTYGRLASDYASEFAGKWTGDRAQTAEHLLGSPDIQSMADLDSSLAIVHETKLFPFDQETIIHLVIVVALPLLPLALTMFSLEELLKRLVQVVL